MASVSQPTGTDIFIAGVYANRSGYFEDYHATGLSSPIRDAIHSYSQTFLENDTHTTLQFSRVLETGDDTDDYNPISNQPVYLLWSYGETDDIVYHGVNRGQVLTTILDRA